MRLIDADALNTVFCQECIGECACCQNALGDIVHMHCKLINESPTIDAVPVVRCRDCTWFNRGFCMSFSDDVKPDDFCSRGHIET